MTNYVPGLCPVVEQQIWPSASCIVFRWGRKQFLIKFSFWKEECLKKAISTANDNEKWKMCLRIMWPWRTNNTSEIYFFLPPSHFILIFTVNTTFLIFNHIPLFVPFFDFLIFSPFYFEFTQFIIYSDVTCCPAVLGLLILKSTTNSIHNKNEAHFEFYFKCV